jgi:hypothetical protein
MASTPMLSSQMFPSSYPLQKLGTDIANVKPMISDVAANLTTPNSNIGFRIIMDEDKSSILVSGEDGYIYLVGTDEKYDLSSPWETTNL